MCRRTLLLAGCAGIVALAGSVATAAGARELPRRFLPVADEGLVQLTEPLSGKSWSAWSYRNGGERDLAISVTDARGLWLEPELLGLGDGLDQVEPALAAHASGALYLVWAERPTGRIQLAWRAGASGGWSRPILLAAQGASSPAIELVGDWLVIAFQSPSGTTLVVRPRDVVGATPDSIQQGPDPVGSKPPADPGDENDQDSERRKRGRLGGYTSDTGPTEFQGPHDRGPN
jgi:hypothetical protein